MEMPGMRKPLVVYIHSEESALTLEREALKGIDCDIVSAVVHTEEEIVGAIKDADVVLNNYSVVPRSMFEQLNRCRLMVRYGHGYDRVDVEAATDHGVMITNMAGVSNEEVSNHALMLLLACARDLKRLNTAACEGRWTEVYSRSVGRRVYGDTVGIVGLGNTGRAMARKCRAIGLKVVAHDPFVGDWIAVEYNAELVSMNELLERSDYVSLHCPLSEATHHLINHDALRRMKPSAYLINTSRGPVVDEEALIAALEKGEIAGAGIDVFEAEPIDPENPLLHMDNVILTPHVAGSSQPAWDAICRRAGEEAARVLRGGRPEVLVNPEVLGRSRPR